MGLPTERLCQRSGWVLERHWGANHGPLPYQWVLPKGTTLRVDPTASAFDFSSRVHDLCRDIVARCPTLGHIDPDGLLISFTQSRSRTRHGLQARVTPMRFRDGELTRRFRGVPYRVQRYFVNGREMLYLVTFCLPRFLDQTFGEKMVTIFHELYHIGTRFDGDLRRHPGRYAVHSHSKRDYDRQMAQLAREYLDKHPNPDVYRFLRTSYADLWRTQRGIAGVVVPRPKLVPVELHWGN